MNQNIKNLIGILTSFFIIIMLVVGIVEAKNRISPPIDPAKTRSVTMSAEAKVTAKPDTGIISFSVVTQGKGAAKVQEENDKKMKNVIDFLKSKGVKEEDIKTSNYNLYPQYDYNVRDTESSPVPPPIVGYNLTQSVTVKIRDLDKVSEIVSNLTSKGVNQIDSLSYLIDDPDRLKAEARAKAVDKAKDKAQELAAKLGVKLGKVINFSEGDFYLPQPYLTRDVLPPGAGGGGVVSPVEPGSQDVTVNVTLTFELK